eukprot:2031224-Amphidinium_carterae.1
MKLLATQLCMLLQPGPPNQTKVSRPGPQETQPVQKKPPPATALPLHPDLVHEPPPAQLCQLLT